MRFIWLYFACFLGFLSAHKAQIIQTYVYSPNIDEFEQEIQDGFLNITIKSKDLLDFMASNALQDRLKGQLVQINQGYTEFKSSDHAIDSYSNSLNPRLKFNLAYNVYELEYLGNGRYWVKNMDHLLSKDKKCNFVIQKTLTDLSDAKRAFVINLNKHYFSRTLATNQFLQCLR